MPQVLNAKNRPFSWSISALNNYEGCPKRYAAEKFYCTLPYFESDEARWGNRVHKAGEMYLKGEPWQDNVGLRQVEKFAEAMIRSGNQVEAEVEYAITRDFKRVKWFAKEAWLRIKIDVVITKVKDKEVIVYDWKTGKSIRSNPDQLHLAMAVLKYFRQDIKMFKGAYIYTAHQKIVPIDPVPAEKIKTIWKSFTPRVEQMNAAWDKQIFPARPSGLCPWCRVGGCTKRQGKPKFPLVGG